MKLVKENYDAKKFWLCPMCGKSFYADKVTDTNDDGTQLYMDTDCPNCGAMLTVVCNISHVCVWENEE